VRWERASAAGALSPLFAAALGRIAVRRLPHPGTAVLQWDMAESSFILIPGADGMALNWHVVVPLLEQAGCEAIAVDLPADDPRKGLDDYADVVIRAIGARAKVVPGQRLGNQAALSQPEELADRLLRFGRGVFR
jgi:hypothetical protein